MKINLRDIHSPCFMCFNRFDHAFDVDNDSCQRCENNIAIQILKAVLKMNDDCGYCTHCIVDGEEQKCNLDSDIKCESRNQFAIDWKMVCEIYNIETIKS